MKVRFLTAYQDYWFIFPLFYKFNSCSLPFTLCHLFELQVLFNFVSFSKVMFILLFYFHVFRLIRFTLLASINYVGFTILFTTHFGSQIYRLSLPHWSELVIAFVLIPFFS